MALFKLMDTVLTHLDRAMSISYQPEVQGQNLADMSCSKLRLMPMVVVETSAYSRRYIRTASEPEIPRAGRRRLHPHNLPISCTGICRRRLHPCRIILWISYLSIFMVLYDPKMSYLSIFHILCDTKINSKKWPKCNGIKRIIILCFM